MFTVGLAGMGGVHVYLIIVGMIHNVRIQFIFLCNIVIIIVIIIGE